MNFNFTIPESAGSQFSLVRITVDEKYLLLVTFREAHRGATPWRAGSTP
jgi:hypothetical protein